MSSVVVSADGIPIHYEVHGDGTTALVFVHGWCCDRSYWDQQVSHFAREYTVVAVDLAGHGDSGLGRKAYTMAAFGEDVVAVVDTLALERVMLVGHSMGGPVIIEAARRIPERVIGLVGVDTFRAEVAGRSHTSEQIEEQCAPFRADFVRAMRSMVRSMFVASSDPASVEQIVADMSAAPPEVGISAAEELVRNYSNLREGLREVRAPVVAINSDRNPPRLEGFQRYGIELVLMSGVGHFVMIEDSETFNTLLCSAVRRFAAQKTS